MKVKKLFFTATASLLALTTLFGCASETVSPSVGEEDGNKYGQAVIADDLAYKYGEAEKAVLAADGLFYDFESETVGTRYTNDDESSIRSGMFTYRPKYSSFEVVVSEDGNALRYERNEVSAQHGTDPHIDIELDGKIPAKASFVAEFDVMPQSESVSVSIMQTIYRPTSGNVFGTSLTLEGGTIKRNGKTLTAIPVGEFSKVACVIHQNTGTMDLYVNGRIVATKLAYIEEKNIGHEPDQVRLVHSKTANSVLLIDNVAVYRGSEPKYIDVLDENDVDTVRAYLFDGAEGAYGGENGLSVGDGNSTYNIIKTPDGRSSLKNTVKGADVITLDASGCDTVRCFSGEIYLADGNATYTLAKLSGAEAISLLEVRGTTLWDGLTNTEVYDLGVGKWARVDLLINGTNNTYSIYVNGYRYADGRDISATALSGMTSIVMGATKAPQKEYSVYLDNIRLYNSMGILGYNGIVGSGYENVYVMVSPEDYSVITPGLASEFSVTDTVKGTGETTAKLSGFTKNFTVNLKNTGFVKQATGDYDLTSVDAVRVRYYSPHNAGRAFVFIFDCGNVYKDTTSGMLYYDGSWKETSKGSGIFTCDKYSGVKAEKQWSYYNYTVTLDSEGWATVTLPITLFKGTRLPDWRHVEAFRIEPQGWSLDTNQNETTILPDSKAEYYLDTIELIVYEN